MENEAMTKNIEDGIAPKEREFCEWMLAFNNDPEFVRKFTTLFIDACNERVARGGYPLHVVPVCKPTFAYSLAMYLTRNNQQHSFTAAEMQAEIEMFLREKLQLDHIEGKDRIKWLR